MAALGTFAAAGLLEMVHCQFAMPMAPGFLVCLAGSYAPNGARSGRSEGRTSGSRQHCDSERGIGRVEMAKNCPEDDKPMADGCWVSER